MKNYYYLLLGAMTLASCSKTFEPNIDYGDRTYVNDYSSLVEAVNNLNEKLDKRLEALNALITSGLNEVKLSIDANTNELTIAINNQTSTIANGFTALGTTIDNNGTKVVTAIGEHGELMQIAIDEHGNLLKATIETEAGKIAQVLTQTINNQTTTLAQKIEAMQGAIANGLVEVKNSVAQIGETLKLTNTALGDINGAVSDLNNELSKAVSDLNSDLNGHFTIVKTHLESISGALAGEQSYLAAINKNGELLQMVVDNTGKLVVGQTKFDTFAGKNLEQLAEVTKAVNALGEVMKADNQTQVDLLKELMKVQNAGGLYMASGTGKKNELYMTPELWNEIDKAGESSNIYGIMANMLDEIKIPVKTEQWAEYADGTHDVHKHVTFTRLAAKDTPKLYAGNLSDFSADGYGNPGQHLMQVVKTAKSYTYRAEVMQDICSHPYLFWIEVKDAKGNGAWRTVYGGPMGTTEEPVTGLGEYNFEMIIVNGSTIATGVQGIVHCRGNMIKP